MEPQIQYAKTSDGVSIAFSTLGEGTPYVHMPFSFSHLQLNWEAPEDRSWSERLAKNRQIVRYDSRGTGLSDRDVNDLSLDARVRDLEAVVGRLGLERFALFAPGMSGPASVAYAVRHPERVSHLILWNSAARSTDLTGGPQVQAVLQLANADWKVLTETLAHVTFGWSAGEQARRYAAVIRESVTQEGLRATLEAPEIDVTELLPQVTSPTLVIQRRETPFPSMNTVRGLASRIPNARLVLLEGDSANPTLGNSEAVHSAIDEFLGEGDEAEAKAELPEGMAVILFADIANSTALTEQLGDAAFREKARELDTSLRVIIGESGGTPVEGKVLGDGVLAVFTSARQAIECALRCNAASEPVGLQLHLGIHAGDVIREGNNVYGGAVNIAARIATASAPGEVLVSDTVRGLARTSAGVTFDDLGEHELKGIAEPQRLFAVKGGR